MYKATKAIIYSGSKINGTATDYTVRVYGLDDQIVFAEWKATTIPGFILTIDEIPSNNVWTTKIGNDWNNKSYFAYLSDRTNTLVGPDEGNMFQAKGFRTLNIHISNPDGITPLVNGANGFYANHIIELVFYSHV